MPSQIRSRQARYVGSSLRARGLQRKRAYDRRMKFMNLAPFADPDAAARKLVEMANATDVVQVGCI
jgi:hypothetical protein